MEREAPAPGSIIVPAATPARVHRPRSRALRRHWQCGEWDRGAFQRTSGLEAWVLQRGVSSRQQCSLLAP
jgi:hypothetical protein